jgi:hypothetical protein
MGIYNKKQMADFIITDKHISYIVKNFNNRDDYRLAEDNWNLLTREQKEFIFEFLKVSQDKKIIIKEAWYNTLGDVVGIFDPTGVVDLVNGVSYINQGELLFGFLSVVSAVPYIGDFVAKPVMGALKLGNPSAKALNGVLKTAKSGNMTKAADDLAKLTSVGGVTGKFVNGMKKVAPKLKDMVNRMPDSVLKGGGIKRTLLQWIELFEQGAKRGFRTRVIGANLAKNFKKLSPAEASKRLEELISLSKNTKGVFTGYRTNKGFLSTKTLFGGMPQLIGRNKSVRSLMRQTKWWLGFLDFLGLGNWVGPDETIQMLGGVEQMVGQMESYNKTPEAKQYFQDEFGQSISQDRNDLPPPSYSKESQSQNPFELFLNKLIS